MKTVFEVEKDKDKEKQFINYHPVLPSLENAENNYNDVTSDHVPILTDINGIRIISWNVLENDSGNGFGLIRHQGKKFDETDTQRKDRHIRIAQSLASFIKENSPIHFITLQEITANVNSDNLEETQLLYHISRRLPKGWEVAMESDSRIGDQNGVITLYNTKHYKLLQDGYAKSHPGLAGNVTIFKQINNNEFCVEILNVHSDYNLIPVHHEKEIDRFLTNDLSNTTQRIVIGDFNCHIAPLTKQRQNNTTSATPASFRDNKYQGACAIDGAFYASTHSGTTVTRQASFQHLNPKTGKTYTNSDLTPLDIQELSDDQANEIMWYRPIICLDASLRYEKWIKGKSINDYEKELSSEYGPLVMREARNLNNEKALAILMPNNCLLKKKLTNSDEINVFQTRIEDDKKTGKPYTIVCIPEDKLNLFFNFIFNEKIQEVKDAAKAYDETIIELATHLTEAMLADNENSGQHIESLKLVYQVLHHPTRNNIFSCAQHANEISRRSSKVSGICKIISGTLLSLAGALTLAFAATIIAVPTIFSIGISAPLTIPVGLAIGGSGLALLGGGLALIASGVKENKSALVSSAFKDLYNQISMPNTQEESFDSASQPSGNKFLI